MAKSFFIYMIFIYFLMLILYILMYNYIHPIFMIILTLIYTMIVCLIMSMWSFNFMYSIITFLMMISGMLIIFLYFSSLISNEQFKFNSNMFMLINFSINVSIMLYLMMKPLIQFLPISIKNMNYNIINNESLLLYNLNNSPFYNIYMIYKYPYNNFTLLCIFYLFLALFMIIKICSFKSLTLRKIK